MPQEITPEYKPSTNPKRTNNRHCSNNNVTAISAATVTAFYVTAATYLYMQNDICPEQGVCNFIAPIVSDTLGLMAGHFAAKCITSGDMPDNLRNYILPAVLSGSFNAMSTISKLPQR